MEVQDLRTTISISLSAETRSEAITRPKQTMLEVTLSAQSVIVLNHDDDGYMVYIYTDKKSKVTKQVYMLTWKLPTSRDVTVV